MASVKVNTVIAAILLTLNTTAAALPEQAAQPKPAKPKLICQVQERIGTRLGGKRICYTKEKWAEMEADSRNAVATFQRERQGNPTNGQ